LVKEPELHFIAGLAGVTVADVGEYAGGKALLHFHRDHREVFAYGAVVPEG